MLRTGEYLDSSMWNCLKGNEVLHIADDIGIVKSKSIGNMSFIYSKLDCDSEAMIYYTDTKELLMCIAGEVSVHDDIRQDMLVRV
jgi:hypothetical protein